MQNVVDASNAGEHGSRSQMHACSLVLKALPVQLVLGMKRVIVASRR